MWRGGLWREPYLEFEALTHFHAGCASVATLTRLQRDMHATVARQKRFDGAPSTRLSCYGDVASS